MNSTHMMINPNELVIDMPVDEGNVKLKMESLQSSGMVQPVTVWLQDLRIIDGFHRTEAAKRLGWAEISCNVIDCTEDAFWDARIQSAKQHHAIEAQRLEAWMLESWKATEWDEIVLSTELRKIEEDSFGIFKRLDEVRSWSFFVSPNISIKKYREMIGIAKSNGILCWRDFVALENDEARRMFGLRPQQVVETKFRAEQVGRDESANEIGLLLRAGDVKNISMAIAAWNALLGNDDLSVIRRWLVVKADQWGVDVEYVSRSILKSMGLWMGGAQHRIACALQLSLTEAVGSQRFLPDAYTINTVYQGDIDAAVSYVGGFFNKKDAFLGISDEDEYGFRNDLAGFNEKQQAARAQWEQTPQGQTVVEKQRADARLSTLRYGVKAIKDNIESISHVVGNVPEAPAMLAELAQYLHDFIAQHLPQLETPDANPIALENAKLRKENEALRDRVASLERALQSQESAGALLAGAVAWSSTDLDR